MKEELARSKKSEVKITEELETVKEENEQLREQVDELNAEVSVNGGVISCWFIYCILSMSSFFIGCSFFHTDI